MTTRTKMYAVGTIVLYAGIAACAKPAESPVSTTRADASAASAAPSPLAAKYQPSGGDEAAGMVAERVTPAQLASTATTFTDSQRKFIRTAHLNFRVKDVYRSALVIEDVVAGQGGFVEKNDIAAQVMRTQSRPRGAGKLLELAEYQVHGNLAVRVPSARTQEFLRGIIGQIEFLEQRAYASTDAQFDMLRQALAYQRSQEAQKDLHALAEQNGKVNQRADVLEARSAALAQRDEALVAQKEFDDKVAFSSIEIAIYQASQIRSTEVNDVEAVFAANGPPFWPRLGSALRSGWFHCLDLLIDLLSVWPLWLVLGALVALYRQFRRRKAAPE